MTNTNTKYTTLEQSQRLKEIGFQSEADGYYLEYVDACINNNIPAETCIFKKELSNNDLIRIKQGLIICTYSFRLDTLLEALPEGFAQRIEPKDCLFETEIPWYKLKHHLSSNRRIALKLWDLYNIIITKRGPEAIAAIVDLICLLKEVD